MNEIIDDWKKIWNKKMANEELLNKDFETAFMELKRLTGNDTTGKGVEFQSFMKQYADIKTNICNDGKWKIKSVFEVGCGSGPFLLAFQRDGYKIGGVDYSKSLINVAQKILANPIELTGEKFVIKVKFPKANNTNLEYADLVEYIKLNLTAKQIVEE